MKQLEKPIMQALRQTISGIGAVTAAHASAWFADHPDELSVTTKLKLETLTDLFAVFDLKIREDFVTDDAIQLVNKSRMMRLLYQTHGAKLQVGWRHGQHWAGTFDSGYHVLEVVRSQPAAQD